MKTWVLGVMMAAAVGAGCGQKPGETKAADTNEAENVGVLTAPADYVGAVGRAVGHSARVVDAAAINNALRQFHAVEDRYPRDLNELVSSGYLAVPPTPPAGHRFAYDPNTGQVRIVPIQ